MAWSLSASSPTMKFFICELVMVSLPMLSSPMGFLILIWSLSSSVTSSGSSTLLLLIVSPMSWRTRGSVEAWRRLNCSCACRRASSSFVGSALCVLAQSRAIMAMAVVFIWIIVLVIVLSFGKFFSFIFSVCGHAKLCVSWLGSRRALVGFRQSANPNLRRIFFHPLIFCSTFSTFQKLRPSKPAMSSNVGRAGKPRTTATESIISLSISRFAFGLFNSRAHRRRGGVFLRRSVWTAAHFCLEFYEGV